MTYVWPVPTGLRLSEKFVGQNPFLPVLVLARAQVGRLVGLRMYRTESIVDEVKTCHKFRNGSVTSSGAERIPILENRMTASFQEWYLRRDNGALLLEVTVHAGSCSKGRRMLHTC